MPEEFFLPYEDTTLRVRLDSPENGSVGNCVLIQSGHVGCYDQPSVETALYESLLSLLNQNEIGVLRLDLPVRGDVSQPAGPKHLAARTHRVRRLLEESKLTPYLDSYVLCGMSLGAQTTLQLITEPGIPAEPRGVILISCVVEEPKVVLSKVPRLQFVYGSRDYIAYVDENPNQDLIAIRPEEYGPQSVSMMILRPWQRCGIQIFEGLGHQLQNGQDFENNPAIAWLSKLITSMLKPD